MVQFFGQPVEVAAVELERRGRSGSLHGRVVPCGRYGPVRHRTRTGVGGAREAVRKHLVHRSPAQPLRRCRKGGQAEVRVVGDVAPEQPLGVEAPVPRSAARLPAARLSAVWSTVVVLAFRDFQEEAVPGHRVGDGHLRFPPNPAVKLPQAVRGVVPGLTVLDRPHPDPGGTAPGRGYPHAEPGGIAKPGAPRDVQRRTVVVREGAAREECRHA
ncbi:hypothetical protein D9M72_365880 [compost metagenome]